MDKPLDVGQRAAGYMAFPRGFTDAADGVATARHPTSARKRLPFTGPHTVVDVIALKPKARTDDFLFIGSLPTPSASSRPLSQGRGRKRLVDAWEVRRVRETLAPSPRASISAQTHVDKFGFAPNRCKTAGQRCQLSSATTDLGTIRAPDVLQSRLPGSNDIWLQVFQWLPVSALPATRRTSSLSHAAISDMLERKQELHVALQNHIEHVLLGQDQRVWVAIRARNHENETCCQVFQNCVEVQGQCGRPRSNPDRFFFDAAFGQSSDQSEVWGRLEPQLMRSVVRRENVCVLAYGQTGSGKTHTMFGDPYVQNGAGVAYRLAHALGELFRSSAHSSKGSRPIVDFSFLEVYNEKVHDLLSDKKVCPLTTEYDVSTAGDKFHTMQHAGNERVVPQGLTRRRCTEGQLEDEVIAWVLEGTSARIAGRTAFNERSSRSHAIATLHICWEPQLSNGEDARPTPSLGNETRLYIVDLAGSERAGRFALSAEQLREGVNINKSLSTLARVVGSLARGRGGHVPFRDSALTWLLSDAITGRSGRAFMIATVHTEHSAETMSTLRYAQEYSTLRSDLSSRIAKLTSQVRFLHGRLTGIRREYDKTCAEAVSQAGRGHPWTAEALRARMVKSKTTVRQSFKRHPHLLWTDNHFGKQSIGAIGVVESVADVPTPRVRVETPDGRRLDRETPDGRRLRPRRGSGNWEDDDGRNDRTNQRVAMVRYEGRHGRPSTFLWYPESALVDVPPPLGLSDLLSQAERVEVALTERKDKLLELKDMFSAEQQRWLRVS